MKKYLSTVFHSVRLFSLVLCLSPAAGQENYVGEQESLKEHFKDYFFIAY